MPLVSKSEAARLAGVTRQTIHRKIKSGDLSASGGQIDTSELLRVFGTLQRPLDINDKDSGNKPWTTAPDPAVEVLARVDALETQLAVTREQLADTARDRDEWREIAKEATSNVKLITNQGPAPKNNDNIAIFVAGAFALGLLVTAMYFMTQQNQPVTITPEPVTETQPKTPEPITSLEQLSEDAGIDFSNLVAVPVEESEQPDGIDFSQLEAVAKEQAEKGAEVTAGLVTDPELIERLRYLHAKKVKTMWTIGMQGNFAENLKSLEQVAEEKDIDLSLLQSIDITDEDIADYLDSLNQSIE